jgi:3-deoxy-7-phosphoheptulonate synthase
MIKFVKDSRQTINRIRKKEDKRLLVILGPCSIHDVEEAYEYALWVKRMQHIFRRTLFLVMRVYIEKPRSVTGWEGLLNDPYRQGNSSGNIRDGLVISRELFLRITKLGVPIATEILDRMSPSYLGDLISLAFIGARTVESQPHRHMVSGLSMPVGFKNGTDGKIKKAVNSIIAASKEHTFPGFTQGGKWAEVKSAGNKDCFPVHRGGDRGPNYELRFIQETEKILETNGLETGICVDCSHNNSVISKDDGKTWQKNYHRQIDVFNNLVDQKEAGNDSIMAIMLESNLEEGRQDDGPELKPGVSITDAGISCLQTERLLRYADKKLLENGVAIEEHALAA